MPSFRPGIKVDGFQLPEGLAESVKTPQAIVYNTAHSAKDLIAFFQYHAQKDWGGSKLIPNGLQISSMKAPFSYISLQKGMDGLMVILSPNVAFEKKPTGQEVIESYGVPMIQGAKLMTQTPQSVMYTSNKPIKEVFDFYEALFKGKPGINLYRMDSNNPPVMSISTLSASSPWTAISATRNPMGGGVMISIVKKTQ